MNAAAPTFVPLYRQIKTLILQGLESGEWRPGEAIPSESELANRFNVSQGTVRKAVDEMAGENLVVRRQGKGTFVASHEGARAFFRFLKLAPVAGGSQTVESVPLECLRGRAGADPARALDLEIGAQILILRRILQFDEQPVVAEEIYLPGEPFKGLTLEVLNAHRGSLYSLFELEFGVRMVRAEEKLRAVSADRTSAELLGVAEGSPLLSVERVAFTYGDKPMEWRRGLYCTDRHHYVNELS